MTLKKDKSFPEEPFASSREVVGLEQDDSSIVWREVESTCKPAARPLSEFLSGIQLLSSKTPEPQAQTPLLVFMPWSCMQAMEAHAGGDILNEQAGIIYGHAYAGASGQLYIVVTSVLPADTTNSPIHFRFHERSWEKLWIGSKDGSNLLGWYHSHPGVGVFLSGTDLRTQQLYFSAPWQIAVVLDPVSRGTAAFHGAKGERVPQENLIIYC